MKKLLATLALVSTAFLPATSATATNNDGTAHLWTCSMDFDATARGLQVLVGKFKFKGKGEVQCYSPLTGQTEIIPIKIRMSSKPVALRIGMGRFRVKGHGAQISLFANAPEDILGKYIVATASVSAGVGIGGFVATHAEFPSLTLNFGLQTTRGFGFDIGIKKMTISRSNAEVREAEEDRSENNSDDYDWDYDYTDY